MPLAQQFIPVVPIGVDQRRDPSELPPGKLVEATNVRQSTPGVLDKRNGYSKIARTADSGTRTLRWGSDGSVEVVTDDNRVSHGRGLESTGEALALRTRDHLFLRSEDLSLWLKKAEQTIASMPPAPQVLPFGYKPCLAETSGGLTYYFAGNIGQNAATQVDKLQVGGGSDAGGNVERWWYYRVVDSAGAEVVPASIVGPLTDITGWQARAVVASGFVWLFVGASDTGGRYINLAKFDPASPEAAPTFTVFYDAGTDGSRSIAGWDVKVTPAGDVLVTVIGTNLTVDGGLANGAAMLLDVATGLPLVSPGVVGLATAAESAQCCVGLMADGADPSPSAFYVLVGDVAGPFVYSLNTSTLALTASVTLAAYETITATSLVTGYHDGPQDRFVTFFSDPGPTAAGIESHDNLVRRLHSAAGGAVGGSINLKRGMSVCSRPFLVGERWCVIGQYDDDKQHAQGSYVLLDVMTGTILGRALHGSGGDAGQRASFTSGGLNYGTTAVAVPAADRVRIALNSWDGAQYVTAEVVFVFDETLGPLVTARPGEETVVPGAWPLHICGGQAEEYVPIYPHIAPSLVEVAGATLGAGYYGGCYVFRFVDSAGNVHRSAPSPVTSVHLTASSKNIEWTVDKLRMSNWPEKYEIELYLTEAQASDAEAKAAALFFQYAVPNDEDPTVNALQFTMAQTSVSTNEELYTFAGGELPNDAAPPFRAAFVWRDRLFLLDTDVEGDVWVSKEKRVGFGFAFSADLAFNIAETGRVYAGSVLGFDRAVLFSERGIWLIGGPGPDSARGGGQYDPVRLPGIFGTVNARSICPTAAGVTFRAVDGRSWLVTLAGGLVDLNAGVESFKRRTVAATVFDTETQQVRVHLEPEV